MQRALIVAGIVLLLIGLAWPILSKLPLFRLPGDFAFGSDKLRVYIPITTMLLLSLVLTLLLWLFRR